MEPREPLNGDFEGGWDGWPSSQMDAADVWANSALAVSAVLLSTVPASQLVAAKLLLGTARSCLRLPISGGARTLVLQAASWATWFASLLIACPVLYARWHSAAHNPHLQLLSVAAAIGGVCALLFLLQSLMVFAPSRRALKLAAGAFGEGQKDIAHDVGRLPSRWVSYYVVCGMGVLWALMAGSLLLATEFVPDAASRLGYYALAAVCATAGTFSTYGLAGHLRWSGAARPTGAPAAPGGWRFWQPLRGGAAFVACQALGWTLYSTALAGILYLIWQGLLGTAAAVASSVRQWALATGAVMCAAQVVLLISLATFKGPDVVHGLTAGRWALLPAGALSGAALRRAAVSGAIISLCYIQIHLFVAAVALSYMVLHAQTATCLWAAALFLYYSLTSFGEPEITGRREWPWLKGWVGVRLEPVVRAWLGSYEVVRDGSAAFDPKQRYIFGYTPHGLYPIFAGLVPLSPSFAAALPGLRPVTLTASVCFLPPVLRDIMLWLGGRVVSRRSFLRALAERGSVVVVPGGQAELCMTHLLHREKKIVLYTGHKGFVRLAIEQGAALVPMVVLGEADSLHNLAYLPWLQRLTYKRVGFPVPFVLTGWRGLPLPARTGLRCVIGDPLPPPKLDPGAAPTQGQVDALHARFYAEVERLWLKHRAGFPGYEDRQLVLTDRHL